MHQPRYCLTHTPDPRPLLCCLAQCCWRSSYSSVAVVVRLSVSHTHASCARTCAHLCVRAHVCSFDALCCHVLHYNSSPYAVWTGCFERAAEWVAVLGTSKRLGRARLRNSFQQRHRRRQQIGAPQKNPQIIYLGHPRLLVCGVVSLPAVFFHANAVH